MKGKNNMESVNIQVNDINIEVDYRTELLGIIMWISNYHQKYDILFQKYGNQFYVDEIIKRFQKFSNHKVIKDFERIVDTHGFNYDAPLYLFLQLDENLKVDKLTDYCYKERLQSDESIYDFINELNKFRLEIRFDEFYNEHRDLYKKWVVAASSAFQKYNLFSYFEKYYGYRLSKKLIVNLTPCITNGGFCCDNNNEVYDCFPIFREMKSNDLFNNSGKEELTLYNPFHEFSHAYIDPITSRLGIVTEKTNLFDDIRENMKKQAYPYDTHILNEHIIRALEVRYVINMYGNEKWGQQIVEQEKENGFIYMEPIIDSLCEYENQRNDYQTIDEFYPVIIEKIKEYQLKRVK